MNARAIVKAARRSSMHSPCADPPVPAVASQKGTEEGGDSTLLEEAPVVGCGLDSPLKAGQDTTVPNSNDNPSHGAGDFHKEEVDKDHPVVVEPLKGSDDAADEDATVPTQDLVLMENDNQKTPFCSDGAGDSPKEGDKDHPVVEEPLKGSEEATDEEATQDLVLMENDNQVKDTTLPLKCLVVLELREGSEDAPGDDATLPLKCLIVLEPLKGSEDAAVTTQGSEDATQDLVLEDAPGDDITEDATVPMGDSEDAAEKFIMEDSDEPKGLLKRKAGEDQALEAIVKKLKMLTEDNKRLIVNNNRLREALLICVQQRDALQRNIDKMMQIIKPTVL
jgi:hypothetical protein